MTVVLAYCTSDYAFLAADSCRWDTVLLKKLGPAQKLWPIGTGQAMAIGGQNIDRDAFAEQVGAAILSGTGALEAARAIAPSLFQQSAERMRQYGVRYAQEVRTWFADCRGESCTIVRHILPSDEVFNVRGLDAAGPNTQLVYDLASSRLSAMKDAEDRVRLDQWAYDVLTACSQMFPQHVSLPGIAWIGERGATPTLRCDLHPEIWSGPVRAFEKPVAH